MALGSKSRKFIILALLASMIFVCGTAFYSHLAWSGLLGAFNGVRHTGMVEEQIGQLLSHIDDAETGQRGYLLTQRDNYLEPYNAALISIGEDVEMIRQLTAADPVQQAHINNLSSLIQKKMLILARTISLQKEGQHDQALAVVNTNEGKRVMDSIRKLIDAMRDEEGRPSQVRDARLTAQAFSNRAVTVSLIGVNVLLIGAVAFLVWRLCKYKNALTVCAWSKKVQYEERWIPFEQFLEMRFGIKTSHDLSPEELAKQLSEYSDEKEGEVFQKTNG